MRWHEKCLRHTLSLASEVINRSAQPPWLRYPLRLPTRHSRTVRSLSSEYVWRCFVGTIRQGAAHRPLPGFDGHDRLCA